MSQNAIAVIEAPPNKKIKIEWSESGNDLRDNVSCETANASTSRGSRKGVDGTPGPKQKNPRVKTTKNNLPLLMQDDPENKWSKIVLPSVILWYGDQENVWNVKEPDLEHALLHIISVVYPTFSELKEMKHGGHVYNLVRTASMVIYTVSEILILPSSGGAAPHALATRYWERRRAHRAQTPKQKRL